MLFSMGRNLGFTWHGMSAVNMCLATRMPYTRSTLTMTMLLEISMPLLFHWQLPLLISMMVVSCCISLLMVNMILGRMCPLPALWCLYVVFGWGCWCAANASALLRPMMTPEMKDELVRCFPIFCDAFRFISICWLAYFCFCSHLLKSGLPQISTCYDSMIN